MIADWRMKQETGHDRIFAVSGLIAMKNYKSA
jgi:hypothetical protein